MWTKSGKERLSGTLSPPSVGQVDTVLAHADKVWETECFRVDLLSQPCAFVFHRQEHNIDLN